MKHLKERSFKKWTLFLLKSNLKQQKKASHLSETIVIDVKTIEWLIEQAEKVEWYEKALKIIVEKKQRVMILGILPIEF
jgi:hypothetical protein